LQGLGGMPASPTTSPSQLPASARRRAEPLVKLYEREAYRIYNLALRITCDREAAARATETAFLRHVAARGVEAEGDGASLVEQTVGAARALAPRSKGATGLGKEDALLEAASSLGPPERAAIALISVGTSSAKGIAAAMGTTEQVAESLVKEAKRSFGSQIGVAGTRIGPKLRDWTWAEPPEEIWESVYPQAQRVLVERERAGTEAPSTSNTGEASGKPTAKRKPGPKGKAKARRRPPARAARDSALLSRLLRDAPRLPSRIGHRLSGRVGIWAFRISVLVIILTPAAVIALASTGGKSGSTLALSAPGPSGSAVAGSADTSQGGSTYNALTPKELDQLRLRELDQLREYSQQQADQSLSASQRSDAADKAQQLLALARQRLAAVEQREQQVAAKEQQQSQAKPAPAATPAPQPAPAPAPAAPTGKKKKKHKKKQAATQPSGNSLDNCLFNPDTGTYICPEQ
jgi:hypothetical protein